MEKKSYTYVGILYVNKTKDEKTYLKGKIEIDGKSTEVIGFLNEFQIKNGEHAGEMAKAFSLVLNTPKDGKKNEKTIKKDEKVVLKESKSDSEIF